MFPIACREFTRGLYRPPAPVRPGAPGFVYVVVAQPGAGAVRGSVELVVTVETRFGPLRLGLPEEARAHVGFVIP